MHASWPRLYSVVLLSVGLLLGASVHPATAQDPPPGPLGITFSTYLGGSGLQTADAIAVDAEGFLYVTGSTTSDDFPVEQATFGYQGGMLGFDAFIAKFTAQGALVWSTYFGGSGDDFVTALAVSADGSVYVAGNTTSDDLPVHDAAPAFQGGDLTRTDGFLAHFDPDGSLRWATYFGGTGDEMTGDLALDAAGQAYVVGTTSSDDFPVASTAVQPTLGGGLIFTADAFVVRIDPDGEPQWATYLGGQFNDVGVAVAVDAAGRPIVAGVTNSDDFPLQDPLQDTFAGPMRPFEGDAFVTVLNAEGDAIDFSTYFGGRRADQVAAVAADADGRITIAGWTQSPDFPVTPGALQPERQGATDAFVAQFVPGPAGWQLGRATYLGGRGDEQALAMTLDANGRVWLAGTTSSDDLPLETAVQSAFSGDVDGFVMRLDDGSLGLATYLGGTGAESIAGVAAGTDGVCLSGGTASGDYLLQEPFQSAIRNTTGFTGVSKSALVTCLGPDDTGTAAGPLPGLPDAFALHPNHPNPFNPSTVIRFDVPQQSPVTLRVYDLQGRLRATLVDGVHAPGRYSARVDATGWPSGVYLYRLQAGAYQATDRMVLVK